MAEMIRSGNWWGFSPPYVSFRQFLTPMVKGHRMITGLPAPFFLFSFPEVHLIQWWDPNSCERQSYARSGRRGVVGWASYDSRCRCVSWCGVIDANGFEDIFMVEDGRWSYIQPISVDPSSSKTSEGWTLFLFEIQNCFSEEPWPKSVFDWRGPCLSEGVYYLKETSFVEDIPEWDNWYWLRLTFLGWFFLSTSKGWSGVFVFVCTEDHRRMKCSTRRSQPQIIEDRSDNLLLPVWSSLPSLELNVTYVQTQFFHIFLAPQIGRHKNPRSGLGSC